ncbi:cyclase family protein [bacterium]|nr:cyclase family protein [bacterium]
MTARLVDLTQPIHEGMPTFPVPHHPIVEITQLARHGIENRETRKVILGTHTGTHLDAPRHYIPGGATVEEIALETLIGPASICDLRHKSDQAIQISDLEPLLKGKPTERVLFYTGWTDHYGKWDYFRGHPYLSVEAGRWLMDEGCRLLGMDCPQMDHPSHSRHHDPDSPIHYLLLGAGVVMVENMCRLDQLLEHRFDLMVLPLPITGGDGSPVRAIARVME